MALSVAKSARLADSPTTRRPSAAKAAPARPRGPASAAFEEGERGTIAPGKQADFSVFSADLMTIPEAEIPKAHAVMTVIGGEVVFEESASGD